MALIQIILAIAIIILILMQERSAGITGLLGGEGTGFYQTRRGMEKIVFRLTIILSLVFVALALYQLIRR